VEREGGSPGGFHLMTKVKQLNATLEQQANSTGGSICESPKDYSEAKLQPNATSEQGELQHIHESMMKHRCPLT